jgi:hypothetical protein
MPRARTQCLATARRGALFGTQFFDVEKYPRITFRSTRVARRGDTWMITRAKEEADKWIFPEGSLSLLGHRLMQAHGYPEGLAMFARNAEVFPQSAHVWEDLALARAVTGDLRGAVDAAHRSQAIDAESPTLFELLRRLEPGAGTAPGRHRPSRRPGTRAGDHPLLGDGWFLDDLTGSACAP